MSLKFPRRNVAQRKDVPFDIRERTFRINNLGKSGE